MILDSPTDGKEGMLGTGESFRLCVLSSDFGRCFWVQTNFGTSDKAVTLQTLVRGGQCAKACFQIEEPPESLAYSAKRLKSEQDDEGTQSHRLTLDLMQQWRDKEGMRHVLCS